MALRKETVSVRAKEVSSALKKKGGRFLLRAATYFILTVFVFVFVYPFLTMLLNSFKYDFELRDLTKQWVLTRLNFQNYSDAAKHLNYMHSLLNTLLVVVGSTAGHILSCSFIAYGFARFNFRGKTVMFMLVILTMIIPAQLLMMPLYIQFAKLGWIGSFAPIIVPTWFGFGLNGALFIFLFRQQLRSLPVSYEEAAKIEGCGSMRIYWSIIFPMLRGTMLVAGILSAIWHCNDYFEPSAYLTGSRQLLTQMLSNLNSYVAAQESGAGIAVSPIQLAACVLVILPLLILYLVFQRQFIKSVDLSGLANG